MITKRELKNAAYHMVAAVLILTPAAVAPGILSFTFAGFALGYIREVTEEGSPLEPSDFIHALTSWRDLLSWSLGGLIVGLLLA